MSEWLSDIIPFSGKPEAKNYEGMWEIHSDISFDLMVSNLEKAKAVGIPIKLWYPEPSANSSKVVFCIADGNIGIADVFYLGRAIRDILRKEGGKVKLYYKTKYEKSDTFTFTEDGRFCRRRSESDKTWVTILTPYQDEVEENNYHSGMWIAHYRDIHEREKAFNVTLDISCTEKAVTWTVEGPNPDGVIGWIVADDRDVADVYLKGKQILKALGELANGITMYYKTRETINLKLSSQKGDMYICDYKLTDNAEFYKRNPYHRPDWILIDTSSWD